MPALIIVVNSSGAHEYCDERCYNATGKKCSCVCGGANHGKGLSTATKNTIEMSKFGNLDGRKWHYNIQLELAEKDKE